MSILVDEDTRVIVQGITGSQGSFHTKLMLEYGTRIVAGVTPGKGGEEVHGVPVYNSVREALREHDASASVVFVPAPFALDAALEAIENLELVVIITEGIPVHDSMKIKAFAERHGTRVVGPNTAGIISPGKSKLGIMPAQVFAPGKVGVVSRSGTLAYEIALAITEAGMGQSTLVGIGGDPVVGTSFVEVLEMFEEDGETEAVVLIGEIGGDAEERAAEFISGMSKPVVGYVAGITAPPGKRMGHAGAIITRGKGTAEDKIRALEGSGALVARLPQEIPELLRRVLE
ncbi:MAG: succinate--CoA ligase subunit alpha [Euryarchaeota archaeon]|nr:succinate--CoA ligase subunit alpha [Euryarchaeota archaeon]